MHPSPSAQKKISLSLFLVQLHSSVRQCEKPSQTSCSMLIFYHQSSFSPEMGQISFNKIPFPIYFGLNHFWQYSFLSVSKGQYMLSFFGDGSQCSLYFLPAISEEVSTVSPGFAGIPISSILKFSTV